MVTGAVQSSLNLKQRYKNVLLDLYCVIDFRAAVDHVLLSVAGGTSVMFLDSNIF